MSYINAPVGISYNKAEPYLDYLLMTKAAMLADTLVYNGKFTICSEDRKLYIYDSNNPSSAETGKYAVASSDAVVFTDVEDFPTTGQVEQTIYRKPDISTVDHLYKMTNDTKYSVSSLGITDTDTSVIVSWTTINSNKATWIALMTEVSIEQATIVDSNNVLIDKTSWTPTKYILKYYKGGNYKELAPSAIIFTDVETLPATGIEQTFYRKPTTIGIARHYYVMTQPELFTISSSGITVISSGILTSWTDINANKATWVAMMTEVSSLANSTIVDYDNSGTDTLIDKGSYQTGYSLYYYKDNQFISISSGGGGTSNYEDLTNKPQVNGITLMSNKTSADLKIHTSMTQAEYDALATKDSQMLYCITDGVPPVITTNDYSALNNKPQIDGTTLLGNKTANDLGLATNANLNLKQPITDDNLQTANKTVVGAINSLFNTIKGLSGKTETLVVATLPATPPTSTTVFYVGTASPYNIYLWTSTSGYVSLGTSSVDLSNYLQKSDVIDALNNSSTDKPLSANQGKELNTNKQDKANLVSVFQATVDDTHYPSEKLVKDNLDLKATLTNITDVGFIYETTKTDETIETLANRFGGTWEAMSDRIEDSWKEYPCTFVNSNGTVSNFHLRAKVSENKQFVDVFIVFNMNVTGVTSTSSEIEIANTLKINGTLFSVAGIAYTPFNYYDSTNNSQTCAVYFSSGSNKIWGGFNKTGTYSGVCEARTLMSYSSTFTVDRVFKRFRRIS